MTRQEISGKVIVITGASSGFGQGAALEFARLRARVVLAARRDELLDEVARVCAQSGEAIAVSTDVRAQADVENLARTAAERFGRIDVWINNAGVGAIGRFEAIPLEDHAQVIETNLLGTLFGSYVAYRHFLAQGFGTLINVSSELGKHTVPYYSSYAASKHGVVGLTQSLQQEIDQNRVESVHVCLVMPTAHDTPFFDHAANYSGHEVEPPRPLHDPRKVIDALVGLVCNPKDEKIVGGDGIAKILLKRIAPAVEEKLATKQMHKTQMKDAPPGSASSGSVRSPMDEGTGVVGGRRETRH